MSVLVDTSVWVDHFRGTAGTARLRTLLDADEVRVHPWVVGELALGHLGSRRASVLRDLDLLPHVEVVGDADVRDLIESRRLGGSGLGWVDTHLVASALAEGLDLWTRDRPLAVVATRLGLAFR